MPARSQLTLLRIRGIRIGVDYSWFLVLFFVIWWLSDSYRTVLTDSQSDSEPYVLAVITAVAFFGSIVLHELGHAWAAARQGITISEITLWLFGGVARMTRDTDSPGAEFKIAAAGPAVSLVLALIAGGLGLAIAGGSAYWDATAGEANPDVNAVAAGLAWVAEINAFIFVFNLIPAFPLDGGRIARAIAWRWSGDRNRSTRFAATLGRAFAYVFIGIGLLLAIVGYAFTGIWLALIGFILGQSARSYAVQSEVSSRIEGIRVADVMDAEPVAIPEDASVERALDEYFHRYRWPWFPVVDSADRFQGLIVREVADSVPESSRVGDVFEVDSGGTLRVRDDAPLESLLGNDALRRLGGLAAVDADGRLRGVITADQVGRALREAIASGGASR
jgi:Zn-dependent protease